MRSKQRRRERPMRFITLCVFVAAMLLFSEAGFAKKEKPPHAPFPKDVVDAISCGVCNFMVRKAYSDVQLLFNASVETRVRVNEDDVLTAIEDVCNPFSEVGHWIRQITITHESDTAPFLLGVTRSSVYAKCKGICSTVVEACEAVMDHENMDQLSPRLLRLHEYADAEAFANALCQSSSICTERQGLSASRYEEVQNMIDADTVEEIDPKEMEIERMMDHMERKENRRQTIFSRDEITSMQRAFLRGDKEAVAQVDPSIMDLSDEEFSALQSMIRGKAAEQQQPEENGDDDERKWRNKKHPMYHSTDNGNDDGEKLNLEDEDF
ncbi:hypothetical protein MOQ_003488 [Trypanosoma cruzi marinkellei]|uniref:Saposin B-type domain-containing protein n=1 Tax=Trypanosoma cruzi marinkellei TaxID=85056 RepID=K2NCS6_TRYCR|nr:hypothetical protein MOQ_003488 [Trypanosoma cruzi marinkellei]